MSGRIKRKLKQHFIKRRCDHQSVNKFNKKTELDQSEERPVAETAKLAPLLLDDH